MSYTLGKYIQNIAMVMIFTTFVDLIMPDGDFRKYIKIVLGLIIIITILAPINQLIFKNKPNYTDFLSRYETDIEKIVIKSQNEEYLASQKDIILHNYQEKLKPQMISIIEKKNDVEVLELEIGFNEEIQGDYFGDIESIEMLVSLGKKNETSKMIKIPKIKIGPKTMENHSTDENKGKIEGQFEEKIKTSIIDFYNLPQANINITVQKNS